MNALLSALWRWLNRLAPAPSPSPPPAPEPDGDMGRPLLDAINAWRKSIGLHPLTWSDELARWSRENNASCRARGEGHWNLPRDGWQCVEVGTASPAATVDAWANHAEHRIIMSALTITQAGCSGTPLGYWTFTAR